MRRRCHLTVTAALPWRAARQGRWGQPCPMSLGSHSTGTNLPFLAGGYKEPSVSLDIPRKWKFIFLLVSSMVSF